MKKKVFTYITLALCLGLLVGCTTTSSSTTDDTDPDDYAFGFRKSGDSNTFYGLNGKGSENALSYSEDAKDITLPYKPDSDVEAYAFTIRYYTNETQYWLSTDSEEEEEIPTVYYSTSSNARIYYHENGEAKYFGDASGDYFIGYDAENDCVTLLETKTYIETAPVCGIYDLDEGDFALGGEGGPLSEEPTNPETIPSEDEEAEEDNSDSDPE